MDAWVTPLLPQAYLPETYLGFKVPGIGLIAGVLGLILVGAVTANLLSRAIGTYAEIALDRTPGVRTLYRLFKQIFAAAFAGNRVAFQQVGVIEFPRRGLFAPVLILGPSPAHIGSACGDQEPWVSVFMPTAPNPTTGFLLFAPAQDVTVLEMKIEDGVKIIVSAGLVAS